MSSKAVYSITKSHSQTLIYSQNGRQMMIFSFFISQTTKNSVNLRDFMIY